MLGLLQAYLADAWPDEGEIRVGDLACIGNGWESDVYSFVLQRASRRQPEALVLRIYPGDLAYGKSAREFQAMQRLYRAGYPVPRVLLLERECSPFGRPFVIMEKVEGRRMWPLLFRSSGEPQQRLLTQFCELFLRLHTLAWRLFAPDMSDEQAEELIARELARGREYLARFAKTDFVPALAWLEQHRQSLTCARPAVVHWDFHPDNILLREDGSAVVIDWTQCEVSDARFDLAWTVTLISSYEGEAWRERILNEYARLAGDMLPEFAFFEVYACLKRLLSVAISLSEGAEKLGMRAEAARTMRDPRQIKALRRVYERLLSLSDIRVPEIENMLAKEALS